MSTEIDELDQEAEMRKSRLRIAMSAVAELVAAAVGLLLWWLHNAD